MNDTQIVLNPGRIQLFVTHFIKVVGPSRGTEGSDTEKVSILSKIGDKIEDSTKEKSIYLIYLKPQGKLRSKETQS